MIPQHRDKINSFQATRGFYNFIIRKINPYPGKNKNNDLKLQITFKI